MSFKRAFASLVLLFICAAASAQSPIPGSPREDKDRAETILKRQIEILQQQGFVGKGHSAKRRYTRIVKDAQKAFDEERYEDAALQYYGLLVNPEFKDLVDVDATQMRLVDCLSKAGVEYAALDYAYGLLDKGPTSRYFEPAFREVVDILNRLGDWAAIEPLMAKLQKQFPTLPASFRDEANYLYGRKAFFSGDLENARVIFLSVSKNNRFYAKAIYHVGVLAVMRGDLAAAEKIFDQALEYLEAQKNDPEARPMLIVTLLARGRLAMSQGHSGFYEDVPENSPEYSAARYEEAWSLFVGGKYAEALDAANDYLVRFPGQAFYPESLFLQANAQMELGSLSVAKQSFERLIEHYEKLSEELAALAKRKNLTESQWHHEIERIALLPDGNALIAKLGRNARLRRISRNLVAISKEQGNLKTSQGAWSSVQKALGSPEKKIFFPGETRMRPFGGRAKNIPYRTPTGEKLYELELLQQDLSRRQETVAEALKKPALEKGRPMALRKALEKEQAQLKDYGAKVAALRTKLKAAEAKMPKVAEPKKAPAKPTGADQFDDLISQEVGLLPIFEKNLLAKKQSLQGLSAQLAQRHMARLADDLGRLVRSAYLGEIEVAFLEREKRGKDNPAVRQELIARINRFITRYPRAKEIPQELFRLAELAYEQSKEKFFAQQEVFEKDYDRYLKGGIKSEPKEPVADYSESVEICKRILKEYPDYAHADQVLYLVGYYEEEQGARSKSIAAFSQLIKDHPKSEFVSEAYMRLGENYFEQNQFDQAVASYSKILQDPNSLFYEIALYKIAWSYYRRGNYPPAIDHFLKLVTYTDTKLAQLNVAGAPPDPDGQRRLTDLREEAVTYLALCFSESGSPKEMVAQFERLKMSAYTSRILRRLADLYYDQLRYAEAIVASKEILVIAPFDPEAPKVQARIIDAYEKMGETDKAFEERQTLANLFGPRSDWAVQNRPNTKASQEASQLVEEALIYSASFYHEKAQKDSRPETYEKALEAYRKYIWEFPDTPKAYEMRFFYAEALYAVGNYEAAGYHYDRVGLANPKDGRYLKDAAFSAILSYEKVLDKEGKNFQERAREKVKVQVPSKELATQKTPAKVELTRSEKNLLGAYDHYLAWLPQGEKRADVLFKSGLLLYQANDYPNALARLEKFLELYPRHERAPIAANYVLNAYIAQRDWPKVEKWGRKLLAEPELGKEFPKENLRRLVSVSLLFEAEKVEKAGQMEKSADQYLAIEKEFSGDPLGATALYNAAANDERAGNQTRALENMEALVTKYPQSELVPQTLFRLGKAYEARVNYAKAAQYYERLAFQYPSAKDAPDALYNAALFQEAVGKDREAAKNYLEYSSRNPTKEDAKETQFLAAKAAERAGDWSMAAGLFATEAQRSGQSANRRIESLTRAGQAYRQAGDWNSANRFFAQSVEAYRKDAQSVGAEGRHFAAQARFTQGEGALARFDAVKIPSSPKKVAPALEEKAKRLEESQKIFVDVVAIGDAEMATASLYKMGRSYQTFSEALFAAPAPKGLGKVGAAEYRAQLEEQAFPLEDKAIEAYEKGLQKAYELKVYGPWTQKIMAELRRFRPNQYAPLYERIPTLSVKPEPLERGYVRID